MSEHDIGSTTWFVEKIGLLREAPLGAQHRLPGKELTIRLQSFGDYLVALSIELSKRPKQIESLQLVRCEVRQLGHDRWSLNLVVSTTASAHRVAPVFADVASSLLETAPGAAREVVAALMDTWRRSFASNSELLSNEAMLGLVGELTVLAELLDMQARSSQEIVRNWVGPARKDHDFSFPGEAEIEVKTIGPATERLRISNEHQLESGDVPLALACVRANRATDERNGISLYDLAGTVYARLDEGGSRELFRDRLAQGGMELHDRRYMDEYYKVVSLELYEVSGSTPRITPQDIQAGVRNVSYEISTSDLGGLVSGGIGSWKPVGGRV